MSIQTTTLETADDQASGYRLDDQVGFVLRRATQRHLAVFAGEIPDLTPTQFATLAKLKELGPVSQNELGRQTAMDAATIKGVIDRLKKRGLVTTRPDTHDLRRVMVAFEEAGRRAYQQNVKAAERITEQTLAPLSARERASFLELLKKIT